MCRSDISSLKIRSTEAKIGDDKFCRGSISTKHRVQINQGIVKI